MTLPINNTILNTLLSEFSEECNNVTILINQLQLPDITPKQKAQILAELLTATIHLQVHCGETFSIKSHKLTGTLEGYWSCSVSYDCRIIFTFSQDMESEETLIVLVDIGSHDEVY